MSQAEAMAAGGSPSTTLGTSPNEGECNLETGTAGDFVAEEPTVGLEARWRSAQVQQARDDLLEIANAIEDSNAPRLLRVIETFAEHHRKLIATLGMADEPRSKRRRGLEDDDGLSSLGLGAVSLTGTDDETFGAQAAQGIVSSFTSALGGGETRQIQQLTRALADAKEAGLDDMVPLLKAKLRAMLPAGDAGPCVAATQGEAAGAAANEPPCNLETGPAGASPNEGEASP